MRLLLESGVCTVLSTCWYELLFDQSAYQQHGELRWPKLDWTKEKHSFSYFRRDTPDKPKKPTPGVYGSQFCRT